MEKDNQKQLQIIAKMLNPDRFMTSDDVSVIRDAVFTLLANFKKGNEELNAETKKEVEDLLKVVSIKQRELYEDIKDGKKEMVAMHKEQMDEIAYLVEEIKMMEPKKGEKGDDADEEKIIERIFARLEENEDKNKKEVEEYNIEGEEIVDKINALDYSNDNLIDIKRIKGWEKFFDGKKSSKAKGFQPTVIGNAMDLDTSARADGYAIVWDATKGVHKYSAGSTGTMAIGGTVTDATQGSILFAGASGVLAQDNTNLYWDDTTNYLRIGGTFANEVGLLRVNGQVSASNSFVIPGIVELSLISLYAAGTFAIRGYNGTARTDVLQLTNQGTTSLAANFNTKLGVNMSSPGAMFHSRATSSTVPGTSNTYAVLADGGASTGLMGMGADTSYGYLQSFNAKPMWINQAGNNIILGNSSVSVGVGGVTSPGATLHVNGQGGSGGMLVGNASIGAGYTGISLSGTLTSANYNFGGGSGDNNLYINRPTGGTIYFRENNATAKVTFLSGGNVGIGTLVPLQPLHIAGTDGLTAIIASNTNAVGATAGIEFRYNGGIATTNLARIMGYTQSGGGGDLLFQTAAGGASSYLTKMALLRGGSLNLWQPDTYGNGHLQFSDSSGSVRGRIAVTSGSDWWIHNNNLQTSISFKLARAYDNDQQVDFNYTPGTVGAIGGLLKIGQLAKNNANFTHGITAIYTNGVEAARFDASGRLGIGVTSVTAVLHLKAGTATANTAPLQFTAGVVETTPRAGLVEFVNAEDGLTFTAVSTRRKFIFDTAAQILTNKRNQPRVSSQASTSTLTPEIDTYDVFRVTALAANITIANHSTSTMADGEQIRISLLDNGTARTITFGTNYVAKAGVTLPTTTVISKHLYMIFEWNANLTKYVLLATGQEA